MPSADISYFNWNAVFGFHRRNLPHLLQKDSIYFITYRLADALPQPRVTQWRHEAQQWLQTNPPPHTSLQQRAWAEMTIRRMGKFLDAGTGSCALRDTACQAAIEAPMLARDGSDYQLGDYIIMPNHVHALLKPTSCVKLSALVGPWRAISSHAINLHLGRSGQLWQEEPFDHVVRSPEKAHQFRRYIQRNGRNLPPDQSRLGCGTLFPPSGPAAPAGA